MRRRVSWAAALAFIASLMPGNGVAAQALPPRAQWHASASVVDNPALAPAYAIDADQKTRWGGPFSPGHWFQLDLGKEADIGGVVIRWDSGFTETYLIQASTDAQRWQTVADIDDGAGNVEYVFFPTVRARYLRLASQPKTADWGVSVLEFEPVAAVDAPQFAMPSGQRSAESLWTGTGTHRLPANGVLEMRLPRPLDVAGLQVWWEGARSDAKLEARAENGAWHLLAADPGSVGDTSYLGASTAETVSGLRLTSAPAASIRRLRLLSPSQAMTPLQRYEIKASRANRELYPDTLHRQQVYWTVVGIAAGRQKSVFDEYGNLEAFKGAPLVQPIWRADSGTASAATTAQRTQTLRDGWMPIPSVEWSPQAGLQLHTEAVAMAQHGAPVTLTRYRLRNVGGEPVKGQLALIVRPLQVNPPWQHGGIAPIRSIRIDGTSQASSVRINGRTFVHSLSAVDARAAAAFGDHGETDLTDAVVSGRLPASLSATDGNGLAAAVLGYRVDLQPRETKDIVLAFPLGNDHIDFTAESLPPAPELDRAALLAGHADDAGRAFDTIASQVAGQWQESVGRIRLSLPDRTLVDMMRAQTAYMLLNQTGPALQPGPRNYNRSFLRDGSATASILARMGMVKAARDYLRWYSNHAVHPNGLVSPILNEDGSVNRGFGSDLEHDSQGQFVWLVAEIARVDGGPASVREYEPQVKLALTYLKELRDRTLAPGYLADRPSPQRFHGILAPSISHEGYSVPTHSYWDDYWGLKGWHDAIWLAESWGNAELAAWSREQYEELRASVRRSIEATIEWKGIDYMPASADLGDWDPTSVSIGIDPANQMELMPQGPLRTTFDRYLQDVRRRDEPGALYAYTPYELRNVLTYVHLDQPQVANELLANFMRHRRPAGWHVFAEVVHSLERRDRYMGDMPHTWIGAEYVRMIFGMLMQEDDKRLRLLPGVPPQWLAGEGIRIGALPITYGSLTMTAQQRDNTLRVTLDSGLRAETQLAVVWPTRRKPVRVTVDGRVAENHDEHGIELNAPFRELVAQW
ncbi:MAG TPA: discoidin domain-containing protein [Povalibacter sp.]|uniref:discoidin domain-containing protein n=1 Tax=Povalibacter sp. TaxID=1962978 RepID=UPI002C4992F9|nr:discoidin domain-containing protein [Povalibacter sp.]HMN47106.1 discoidin domain-containing protein [Povalibacter sp.]